MCPVEEIRGHWTVGSPDKRYTAGISRFNVNRKMPHNKTLQLTTNPLRGLSAAELGH